MTFKPPIAEPSADMPATVGRPLPAKTESPTALQRLLLVICPLAFAAAGAFLLFQGSNKLRLAAASWSWPTAPGIIQHSDVYGIRRGSTRTKYRASIHYEYVVGKTKHRGDRVTYGWDQGSTVRFNAQKIADRYPVGRNVTVSYRPDSPQISVLEPGLKFHGIYEPLAGLACLGVSVVITLLVRRRRNPPADIVDAVVVDVDPAVR